MMGGECSMYQIEGALGRRGMSSWTLPLPQLLSAWLREGAPAEHPSWVSTASQVPGEKVSIVCVLHTAQ